MSSGVTDPATKGRRALIVMVAIFSVLYWAVVVVSAVRDGWH